MLQCLTALLKSITLLYKWFQSTRSGNKLLEVNEVRTKGGLGTSLLFYTDNSKSTIVYVYCVFILSAISPYTTGLTALLKPSDYTGTTQALK